VAERPNFQDYKWIDKKSHILRRWMCYSKADKSQDGLIQVISPAKEDHMDAFAPINGISLEKYAELAALMGDTGSDVEKYVAIAEANGVSRSDWIAAQSGWTARMSDVSLMGKVALAFMPLYQAAMDRKRCSG
jgi:hypothetical protein